MESKAVVMLRPSSLRVTGCSKAKPKDEAVDWIRSSGKKKSAYGSNWVSNFGRLYEL